MALNSNLCTVTNYCEDSPCSHLCLLSANSSTNYTCACPFGSSLMADGRTCTQIANVTVTPPLSGEHSSLITLVFDESALVIHSVITSTKPLTL